MKIIILITIGLQLGLLGYAQNYTEQDTIEYNFLLNKTKVTTINNRSINYYLNDKNIDKYAKLYYKRKFIPSDDSITFGFLDSICTKNNAARPFYIFIFNEILKVSDGAIAEGMTSICLKFVTKYPCDFIRFSQKEKLIDLEPWCGALTFTQYNNENISKINNIEADIKKICPSFLETWKKIRANIGKADY
jgi:hypothetical protein